MDENLPGEIVAAMAGILSCGQMKKLQEVLRMKLTDRTEAPVGNEDVLTAFLQAKKVEGRSEKTLEYYEATIRALLDRFDMPFCQMTSAQLRDYLSEYQQERESSKVTIDNIRRIFSSFFSWLEDVECVVKSPVRRIHKVKALD